MENELITEETDELVLSDLVALYRALAGARATINTVMGASEGEERNPRMELEKALIREERDEIDSRIQALCCEIEAAPTCSAADAATKQLVRRTELGDRTAAAEFGLCGNAEFGQSVEQRVAKMQEQLECIAFAINVHVELNDRGSRLPEMTEMLGEQLLQLRAMISPAPEPLELKLEDAA